MFCTAVLKNFLIFELSALEFALLQSLVQNQKPLNLGPKMPSLGIFELEFESNIFIIEISAFKIV